MGSLSIDVMRQYLSTSISSINKNKLNGLNAEINFRKYIQRLGFGDRVSPGGWIMRSSKCSMFSGEVVALFPHFIKPEEDYGSGLPQPPLGLHTICATFHQLGIRSYYCHPTIDNDDRTDSITWSFLELGIPTEARYQTFPFLLSGFERRTTPYNFLRYSSPARQIPSGAIGEEFSKEHLRVTFHSQYFAEISDIDSIFWGRQFTYPLEIKEKVAGNDKNVGDYFGLDVGPFTKLAFYAAKRGNLHSIFVVREISDTTTRNLLGWRFITFDVLSQYASWVPQAGGKGMQGGASTVVKIPKYMFRDLTESELGQL